MRCTKPFYAAALLGTLCGCLDEPTGPAARQTEPGTPPALAMNATTSRVVAYLPTWYSGALDAIRYDKLTHINYAFIDPTPTGGLTGLPMSGDPRLTSLVQKAHANGVKVLISIGGWSGGDDSPFVQMAANATYRASFVNNVATFVDNYGLDGADIDWEYPDANTSEATNYALLMDELNTGMDARGKLLTAAVAATSYYGNGIAQSVFDEVDYLFLMAYDADYPHSTSEYADESLEYWLSRGLPASKAVLGVPFYGRNSIEDYRAYREIVRLDATAPTKDTSNGYYYNGPATIKRKTTLSLQRGSGVGIWELTQDTIAGGTSLLDAIHEAMNSPVPPYDYTKIVYDDTLKWEDWSWSTTRNFAYTGSAWQGTKSISVTYTAAWGGLQLNYDPGISPANFSTVEFYIHGGSTGGQNLKVYLRDSNNTSLTKVSVAAYTEGQAIAANAWRKVSVPRSVLGTGTNRIHQFVIQDGAGTTQGTFYVDYIRFLP